MTTALRKFQLNIFLINSLSLFYECMWMFGWECKRASVSVLRNLTFSAFTSPMLLLLVVNVSQPNTLVYKYIMPRKYRGKKQHFDFNLINVVICWKANQAYGNVLELNALSTAQKFSSNSTMGYCDKRISNAFSVIQ